MKLELVLQKLGLIQPGKIMYIGGSDVLPAPLRPEDERRAIEALAAGDETARQTLIEHNLRLVVYIARRFENTGVNLEDLISIGTIGLIKAVNTFRPDRNIKLATYSSRCIENEILMHIRKIANQKTEVSLDEPINTDWDGNELLLVGRAGHGRGYRHAPAGGRRGPSAAAAGTRPAAGAGEADRLHALRPRRPPGEDAEGGRRPHGHLAVVYLAPGKAHHAAAAAGDLTPDLQLMGDAQGLAKIARVW